jgi:hypothetical protein
MIMTACNMYRPLLTPRHAATSHGLGHPSRMNARSVRTILLAAGLFLLTHGTDLSRPNAPLDPRADLASTANGNDEATYSMAAAQAAAQSGSVWPLLFAQR